MWRPRKCFLLGFCLLTLFCRRSEKANEADLLAYQADAHRLCTAIVECLREDVARRLEEQPERRDMVLGRMSQDLCLKGQYSLLGQLSVNPGPPVEAGPTIQEAYALCSRVVSEAENCEKKQELHRKHPACVQMRQIYENGQSG